MPMGNDRSVLDQIRIASPCSASWDAMEGGDRVRFCAHCQKNVYNLSDMSRREAEKLGRESRPVAVAGGIGPGPVQDEAAIWRRTEIVGGGSAEFIIPDRMLRPWPLPERAVMGRPVPLPMVRSEWIGEAGPSLGSQP